MTTSAKYPAAYDMGYVPDAPNTGGWKDRHLAAVSLPRAEESVAVMIRGWLSMATYHREAYGRGIGQDGYAADPWAAIGCAIHDLLNMETGRLDCGTLSSIILQTLEAEGYDYDVRKWKE